jgi:membrane-associated phospholipid phosphatase
MRTKMLVLAVAMLSVSLDRAQDSPTEPAQDPAGPRALESPVSPDPDGAAMQADDSSPASAADATFAPGEIPYWRTNLFRRFFGDQKFLFKTWIPSEARNPAFSVPFLVTGALGYSFSRDEDGGVDAALAADLNSDTHGTQRQSARFLSQIGDAGAGALLIGTAYLAARWSGHDRLAEASSLSAEAALSAGLWSSVLKAATARNRPSSKGIGDFGDYDHTQGEHVGSFPSGHATGAFAVATVFSGLYPDHRWVSWMAYGTAGLIGVSRISLGRHFPTDVIAGALLGNSMGRMVLARRGEAAPKRSSIQPILNPQDGGVGLAWNYSW